MGNSASTSLPYSIEEERESSSRDGSRGWAIHAGARKSDGSRVSVFKANKANLMQTALHGNPMFGGNMGGSSGGFFRSSAAGGSGAMKADPNSLFFPAMHHFTKSKKLVHPHILRVYATLDTDAPSDASSSNSTPAGPNGAAPALTGISAAASSGTAGDLIIVTEEVVPLSKWLDSLDLSSPPADGKQRHDQSSVAWGLYCIVQALHFLHSNAGMAHAAVCPDSIFVTPGGDFKLGNFSLLTPVAGHTPGTTPAPGAGSQECLEYFRQYDALLCPPQYRSPERVNAEYEYITKTFPAHVMDSFSLGVLIEHLYARGTITGALPDKLIKAVNRMKTPGPTQRPRVGPLVKCPVFDVPLVSAMEFLGEIAVKPNEEKVAFFLALPDQLARNILPPDAAMYKVLPALLLSLNSITAGANSQAAMMQDVLRREVMAIIPPLFTVAELLDDKEFQKTISPVVATLFQLNDRGVRGALLSRLTNIVPRLDKQSINSCVFEPMCSGFTDSSGALRELTLKSTLPLIPNLSANNLEKLVRYLVRLQADSEPSIRTNTVIFITKIAPSLSETSRSKLILPAFTRAMKDPFTPCRLSALKSIMQCREYFDAPSIASKVLPCVVPHCMDAETQVRNEAFGVLEQFTVVLKEQSKVMEQQEAAQQQQQQGQMQLQGGAGVAPAPASGGAAPTSGGSSSYMSGLKSWASSAISSQTKPTETQGGMGTGIVPPAAAAAPVSAPPPAAPAPAPAPTPAPGLGGYNGMSNGAGSQSLPQSNEQQSTPFHFYNAPGSSTGMGMGTKPYATNGASSNDAFGTKDNDDVFSQFDDAFKNPSHNNSLSTGPTATGLKTDNVEDFFSSSMVGGLKLNNRGGTTSGLSMGGASTSTSFSSISGSTLSGQGKSKQSLAERKAEFARRKAEREKKQGLTTMGAKKVTRTPSDSGWDDF